MSGAVARTARPNALRSAQTRDRLVQAATNSLVEQGFAATTAVEVCARAGLSRGAYNHHYSEIAALFADVLTHLYHKLAASEEPGPDQALASFIQTGWKRIQQPEFKAVIELWLASRNNPELGQTLLPLISQLSGIFDPESSPVLAKLAVENPESISVYRLAFEAMIGLAVGRATNTGNAPVDHEEQVIGLLLTIAQERS